MKRKILSLVLSLAMLVSLAVPALAAEATFPDVQGHWGESSVERWAGVGVLNGTDTGSFNPDANMTRAEFAQMMVNLMGYTGKSGSFSDVPSDAWYAGAINALAAAGVMQGDGNGHANPLSSISRAEAAVLLCRALKLEPSGSAKLSFADASSVPSWAEDAMAALSERGMISGVGGNQIAPLVNITRASVAKLIDNMVSVYVTSADQVVTGTVKGLVVVAAAGATFTDATVKENVVVAPKAGAAALKVTGKSTIDTIYISNPDMVLTVEGGTVKNVVIEEGADGAVIDVAKGATINLVTTSADDVTIKGEGTVKEVNILQGDKIAVDTEGTVIHVGEDVTNATYKGKALEPGKTYNEVGGGGGGGSSGGPGPSAYEFIYQVGDTVSAKVNNALYMLGNSTYVVGNTVYTTNDSIYVDRDTLTTGRASSADVYTFAYMKALDAADKTDIATKIIEAFKTVFGIDNDYFVVLSRQNEEGIYILNDTVVGTPSDLVTFLFRDSDKNITGTVYHLGDTPFVFTIEVPRG
ncbi:hypothetical protein CE91St41_16750 [Oscillospiraceae bacterium]|nr:hypothetical protein CE91St40_20790 [Oscillospiraceae bacterium]BDF74786.1 hypothetical protein CE91St41_16750 [Oscillospiraceae bacterium]